MLFAFCRDMCYKHIYTDKTSWCLHPFSTLFVIVWKQCLFDRVMNKASRFCIIFTEPSLVLGIRYWRMGRFLMAGEIYIHFDHIQASQYQSIDWTHHTTYWLQAVFSCGKLVVPGSMYEKTSHETSLDLDSCFDLHWVSSAGLRQHHRWTNTSEAWAQYLCRQVQVGVNPTNHREPSHLSL